MAFILPFIQAAGTAYGVYSSVTTARDSKKASENAARDASAANNKAIADAKAAQETAASQAQERARAKKNSMTQTVFTNPLAIGDQANLSRKSLLGE